MAPKRRLRPSPVGIAIVVWDVWRRLPPRQRKQVLKLAREHGPKVAAQVAKAAKAARSSRR